MEMQLTDVRFEVLTPDLMREYLTLVEQGKAPAKPYYTLTTKQYENLAINMAEIKRYIEQQKEIIIYYENAITFQQTGKKPEKKLKEIKE